LGAGFYWSYYWTSTAFAGDTVDEAWAMNSDGILDYYDNWSALYVLPVRGGQCNNIPCKNLPVANAPVVSVPTAPNTTVANTPLQIYDSIPGDLYCDYLNISKSNWRSSLYVYRILNTVTFQARTSVIAANGVEAQITCNNALNPNVVQTYTLQNSNVINCNVGSTNSIPLINLNVFSPTTN
jgi:hypothetical protein